MLAILCKQKRLQANFNTINNQIITLLGVIITYILNGDIHIDMQDISITLI
jgi:hypothetical protein